MAGSSFGRWTVQNEFRYEGRQKQWLCRCSCGTIRYVNEQNLLNGRSRSCGCISAERIKSSVRDLRGMTFGYLTVIDKAESKGGRSCWFCRCKCGNTVTVSSHQLLSGKTRSCGCLKRVKTLANHGIRDISNYRVGFLDVLYPTDKRDSKGSVYWQCRCSRCGKTLQLTEDELIFGNYKSCGCYKTEIQSRIGDSLHFIDGTCVEWLDKRKHRSDNTSGFRGISRISENRYRAGIGFRKKRYFLGYFDSFEKAVNARLTAEDKLHKAFVDEYREWKTKADENRRWADTNPFSFSGDNDIKKIVMEIKETFCCKKEYDENKDDKVG
jgi:hypothetical protein